MLGVNTKFMLIGTFAVDHVGRSGGWRLVPVIFVFPDRAGAPRSRLLWPTLIGGLGSIRAPAAAAVDVIRVSIATYISSTFRDVTCYSILILVRSLPPAALASRGRETIET